MRLSFSMTRRSGAFSPRGWSPIIERLARPRGRGSRDSDRDDPSVPIGIRAESWQLFAPSELPVIGRMSRAVGPLLIVNPYGLFANMTTARPEIVVEGSDDGQIWREYDFRC